MLERKPVIVGRFCVADPCNSEKLPDQKNNLWAYEGISTSAFHKMIMIPLKFKGIITTFRKAVVDTLSYLYSREVKWNVLLDALPDLIANPNKLHDVGAHGGLRDHQIETAERNNPGNITMAARDVSRSVQCLPCPTTRTWAGGRENGRERMAGRFARFAWEIQNET